MLLSFPSPPSWLRVVLAISVATYGVLWLGGVGQHLFTRLEGNGHNWVASVFLLLAGFIVLLGTSGPRDLFSLLGIAVFGFVVEVIGVRSGLPFGAYSYTGVLQPQLLGVPVVMAFAWMVLVASIKQTLQGADLSPWLEVPLAALWMTAIDLVIDPLAANLLGYWHWRTAGSYYGVPASNFVGWFLSSLLVFALFNFRWRRNDWSRRMGLSIVLFFSLIALAHRLFAVGSIGLALSGIQILFARRYARRN
jgi:putative membrane protein